VGVLEASCAATAEALSDRLEGELGGMRRLRIGRHLARCARCRAMLALLARLVSTLRAVRAIEARPCASLVEDAVARIREGSEVDGHS
jgi:predicted anti-sigma-YlaC factor YlaD